MKAWNSDTAAAANLNAVLEGVEKAVAVEVTARTSCDSKATAVCVNDDNRTETASAASMETPTTILPKDHSSGTAAATCGANAKIAAKSDAIEVAANANNSFNTGTAANPNTSSDAAAVANLTPVLEDVAAEAAIGVTANTASAATTNGDRCNGNSLYSNLLYQ